MKKDDKEKNNTNSKSNKALSKIEKKDKSKTKKFLKKFIDDINKKWLVKGATTILLVAIIFAVYLGVTKLLDKVTLPDIDCTNEKLYSLSEETKTKVSNIDKDIKITLINYKDDESMKSIVEKYKALNKKITIEEIDDLTSRQDITQKYSITSSDKLILVSSGEKEVQVTESQLYTYDYSTYKQIDITEEALTNAIIDVSTETKPKIYFINTHTMYPVQTYYTNIIQTIKDDANEVEMIDLLTTGKVPEDCKCLVITTLKTDFTEPEKNYIIDYINNGGKLLLLCGNNFLNTSSPNFQSILDLYGISLEDGVIFEGKQDNMLPSYADVIIEEVAASSVTKNADMNLRACFTDASAIKMEKDQDKLTQLGITYESLITTTDKAFRRDVTTNSLTQITDGEASPYTVGVLATKEINDKTSKLILYSDEVFDTLNTSSTTQISAYNNKDIVANSISYLNERTDTITIRKNYDTTTYTVDQKAHNIIMAVIFITPLVIIVIGIIVWQIRRRRNK